MLDVRLLGLFEVLRDGERVAIPTRKAQTLFAYLVMNAGKTHRRERLAGILWPNSSEDNARSNLRHELWRLRKVLERGGESYFIADDLNIGIDRHSPFALDVEKLESSPVDGTAETLIDALTVYRGEFLPGFYDEWVFLERDRLVALYEARITRLLDILHIEQRWAEVIDWGTRWITLGQWPEPAYRALMAAYANTGDASKAALIYERYAQALLNDLGIKPSEPTQALYKRLKAGWKQVEQSSTPASSAQPQKPAMKTTAPTFTLPKVRRSNLPKPLTSFIGREKEIQQVSIQVTHAKLVTITGSGGVGKTRLAIQVAEEVACHFKDGVWWVELAVLFEVATPKKPDSPHAPWDRFPHAGPGVLMGADLVTQAIAKTLRVPESPGLPLLEGVVDTLRSQQLLLVLDNCEHLIETCASLVERLLRDCPQVTILATSREALGVPGEKAWRLPSLSLPGGGLSSGLIDLLKSEAVSMFIERTADILPGYQPNEVEVSTIAEICLRLDGIPLAIELAAARMNLLSAHEIAVRLDSRFSLLTGGSRTVLPRHQTLQAAIEWSYDLLGKTERMLFRRLAIFGGSFSLQAVEAICTSPEIKIQDVLTLLGRLVDKSLLNVEPAPQDTELPTRYRFLETIRSFGRMKLDQAQETGWMSAQHANYYVRLVETAEPELNLQDQNHWYQLLQAERGNFLAVVEYGVESDQAERALRLAGALLWFWYRSGSNNEGSNLALKALASPSAVQFKEARARALNTAGFLLCLQGDTTSARLSLEEALTILRASDDKASLSWTLQFLGLVLAYEKEYDLANAAFHEGLELTRKLMTNNTNSFLFFMGDVYLLKGETSRAKKTYEESVNILRAIGNKSFLAYPLRRLGYLALAQNDTQSAWKYFQESLLLNQEVGDMPGLTASLASLSALAIHLKKPVEASRIYGVVENRLESLSINLLYTDQAEYGRIISQLPTYLDKETFEAAISNGCEMSEELAIEMVAEMIEGEN
jgi:predicted ATPase/DNA-binding SARP family transcriptional activator/predicted negative regulator of RcsB-dependent stress response